MIETAIVYALVTGVAAAISVTCYNMRRSRCTKIQTPCCTVERTLMSDASLKADTLEVPQIK